MKSTNLQPRSRQVAKHWKLILGIACLPLLLSSAAMAQSADALWSGQVVCTLSVQSNGYTHQETQTWKLTGDAAKLTGPGGLAIYPATWSVSGQGSTQRTLPTTSVLASSWKTDVPPMNSPLVIFVRASDKRLVIKTYHAPLYSPNGVIGTRQISGTGAAPAQTNLPSSTGEWILPVIEDSPDNSTVTGSATTMVGGTSIPERPGGGNEAANCTWNFTKQGASGAAIHAGVPVTANGPALQAAPSGTPAASNGSVGVSPASGTKLAPSSGAVPIATPGRSQPLALAQISQITPQSVLLGVQNFAVALTGKNTHFQQGVSTADFGNGVTVASLTVTSPTSATAILSVSTSAPMGPRDVKISTQSEIADLPAGQSNATTAFVVGQRGSPWLPAITPNSVLPGAHGVSVSLTGESTHFQQGVSTADFGNGVTVASLTVTSPTSATAVLNVSPTVSPGSRAVRVTTLGETAGPSKSEGTPITTFVVGGTGNAWLPAIAPNSVLPGAQSVSVSLTGENTHFQQGVSTADFGNGVTVASFTITSPTSATALLNITTSAQIGQRAVRVTTLGEIAGPSKGQDSGGPTTVFVVGATGDPVVLPASPNTVLPGTQGVSVSLTGKNTHFQQGVSTANFGNGITVVSFTVTSPTAATAVINVAAGATLGARNITVTTLGETASMTSGAPDGQTVSLFAVEPKPVSK